MYTVPQRIQILKFVGEQGIVSVADICRHLFQSDKFHTVRSTLYHLGVSHIRYNNIYGGLWYIENPKLYELLASYYPNLADFEVIPILGHLIPHYLGLNRIRSTFEFSKQITIDEWWSEHYIRVLPAVLRMRECTPKIPDAIFWRKKQDGSRQKFFLEYERSLKNMTRYEEIFSSYSKRPEVHGRNVIYLCDTSKIREELLRIEARLAQTGRIDKAGECFQFLTLENFYKNYENTSLQKQEGTNEINQTVVQSTSV
ncbi:MAG: hypothetical protein HQL15_06265 [Candidatus Omnitrophica bacterium]|nr:hypothetical protein [Candidatus Omnitrophota bacterium]